MMHTIELMAKVVPNGLTEGQWQRLDVGDGNTLTLDYVSNLLGDPSKITTSRSFTVKLPRTRTNDTAFDLAVKPQHDSRVPYSYMPCRCYVDGMDVIGDAYLYITGATAKTYDVVIVFGVIQPIKTWIDSGKTLRDLADDGQGVLWNWRAAFHGVTVPAGSQHDTEEYPPIWYGDDANINTYAPANGLGRLMHYGIYDAGFERIDRNFDYANVHPFVTMRELWERIKSENALDITIPNDVLLDMEDVALVLTDREGNTPQGTPDNHSIPTDGSVYLTKVADTYYITPGITESGYITGASTMFVKSNGDGQVRLQFYFSLKGSGVKSLMTAIGNDPFKMRLQVSDTIAGTRTYIVPTYVNSTPASDSRLDYQGVLFFEGTGDQNVNIGALQIKLPTADAGDYGTMQEWIGDMVTQGIGGSDVAMYTSYDRTYDYPNPSFKLFKNLPEIKQVDFFKAICQMYGLFPVVSGQGVRLAFFSEIDDNRSSGNWYDWSGILLEDDPDSPLSTEFHMTDYAKDNIIKYKDDDSDPYRSEASFQIADDTLDQRKDLFVLPFAASDGDKIPQYEIKAETDEGVTTYEAEFTKCEPRLMRVTEWKDNNGHVTRLSFSGITDANIMETRYQEFIDYITAGRIVTERMRVPTGDLRDLDYTKPVYLAKYGRFGAIMDLRWTVTQDTCEARLLMPGNNMAVPERIVPTSVDYVQDGLVLHLDGINKGDLANHWLSLVGGYDYQSYGSPTFHDDCVEFDGVDDYFRNNSFLMPETDVGTIEAVFVDTNSNNSALIMSRGDQARLCIYIPTSNRMRWSTAAGKNNYNIPAATLVSVTVNDDRCLVNGSTTTYSGTSAALTTNTAASRIGCQYISGTGNGNFFKGRIYSIRVYNRKLTEAEMRHNLEVDRSRFGIGN